jgi:hypothetical protein
MKQVFAAMIIIVLGTGAAIGQRRKQPSKPSLQSPAAGKSAVDQLMPFSLVLVFDGPIMQPKWSTAIAYGDRGTTNSAATFAADLDRWLEKPINPESKSGAADHKMAEKYHDGLVELFGHYNQEVRTGKWPGFLYKGDELPFRFVKNEQDKLILTIKDVASDHVFNTLKVTPKQRAGKIISSIVLPICEDFYLFFKGDDPDYLSVVLAYGSKSFLDQDARPDAEVVVFLVPVPDLRQFYSHKITDDALLDKAEIYLSDRDSSALRRVKISLE